MSKEKYYKNRLQSMKKNLQIIQERIDEVEDIVGMTKMVNYELSEQGRIMISNLLEEAFAASRALGSTAAGLITQDEETARYVRFADKRYEKEKPPLTDLDDTRYTVCMEGDVVHIKSNYRLPHIKSCTRKFVQETTEIKRIFINQTHQYEKCIGKCYMIFVHHYIDSSLYRRDVDNYYEKPLSDGIGEVFIRGGDQPDNVCRCSFAVTDYKNYSEVFLVPYEQFPQWIEAFQQEQEKKNKAQDLDKIFD